MRLRAGKSWYKLPSGIGELQSVQVRMNGVWFVLNLIPLNSRGLWNKKGQYCNAYIVMKDKNGMIDSIEIIPPPSKAWQCKIKVLMMEDL